jgi:cytochrome c oxidase subunit 2
MRQSAHVVTPAAYDKWFAAAKAKAAGGGKPAGGGGQAAAPDGKAIFTSTASPACGSCHTLSDAGATGTIGPNLDKVLKGKDAAFIKQSIEQPDAQIAAGYGKGIMPPNYGSTLSPSEIDALVKFLSNATK